MGGMNQVFDMKVKNFMLGIYGEVGLAKSIVQFGLNAKF